MATTLEESARRAGGHHWAETTLFEVLGGWVPTTREPEVRVMLDRHSHHGAWRAAQWWERLPLLADVDRGSLCVPAGPEVGRMAERLAVIEGTVPRLAAAYRVAMPRLWAGYHAHARDAGTVADGSSIRTLGIVMADLAADWHEGEVLLQAALTDSAAVRAAGEAAMALEEALAE